MLCKECGEDYRFFERHLLRIHKMNLQTYAEKYSENLINASNGDSLDFTKCKICGSRFLLKTLHGKICIVRCPKCTSHNPLKRYQSIYGADAGLQKYNEMMDSRSIGKDGLIEKYGEIEGKRRIYNWLFKSRQDEQGFIDRYGYELGKIKYQEFVNKSKQTLENFIVRYGEVEGTEKYNKSIINRTKNLSNNRSYYMQKGLSIEEASKEVSRYQKWISGGGKIIDEYGIELGERIYAEQVRKKTCLARKSFIENSAIMEIINILDLEKFDIYFGDKQYFVRTTNGFYLLDFYDKTNNICIEFNGDYYHANPKIYDKNDTFWFSGEKLTAQDIWDYNDFRLNDIRNKLSCKIVVIWENDWYDRKEVIINDIRQIYGGMNENCKN